MPIDFDGLFTTMVQEGQSLAGNIWSQIENFAVPELRKIGVQIVVIAENIGDYTAEGARALFDMQVRASIGIIVAMTALTLLEVQTAINAILAAIRDMVNNALPFSLF